MRTNKKQITLLSVLVVIAMTLAVVFTFFVDGNKTITTSADNSSEVVALKASNYITSVVQEQLETTDAWKSERKLAYVNHHLWGVKNDHVTPVTIATVGGEKAFKWSFNLNDSWAGANGIKFANPIAGTDIDKVTVRLYTHMTLANEYGDTSASAYMSGIKLYGLNATGVGSNGTVATIGEFGYKIPQKIAPEQYVDVEITGTDVSLLLDDDGYFNGVQYGARTAWTVVDGIGVGMYYSNNYVAISEIKVTKKADSSEVSMIKASDFVTSTTTPASVTEDDKWQAEKKLQSVNHTNWAVNREGIVDLTSVGNDYAFKFQFNRGDQWAGKYGVKFEKAIEGAKISAIKIRLAAHLSETRPYGPEENESYYGVYLYNLNDNGAHIDAIGTGGYRIPRNIVQDAFVEINITDQNDINLFLDDTTGNFEGIQFGARSQGTYDSGCYIAVESITVTLKAEEVREVSSLGAVAIKASDFVLESGGTSTSWQTDAKLAKVGGWPVNKPQTIAINDISSEKAFVFAFHRGDQWAGTKGIRFAKAFNGSKIEYIKVRLFAHLSETSPYGPNDNESYFGVYLYNLNDDGTPINNVLGTGGYRIPRNIEQEKYVDLLISGSDIGLFLDDTTGNFEGIQLAARPQGTYNTNCYVAIESIEVFYAGEYQAPQQENANVIHALKASDYVLEGGSTSTSWQADAKIAKVGGWPVATDFFKDININKIGRDYAFTLPFHRGNQWAGNKGIKFATPIDGSMIGAIKVRLYAHLSATSPYGPDDNESFYGAYLYNLTDDGTPINGVLGTGGYRIPRDIKQDQYVELMITGNDIKLFLDDTTGKFEGIQLAARPQGTYDRDCYFAIESIDVYLNYQVSFDLDYQGAPDAVVVDVIPSATIERPINDPVRDGYKFMGWFIGEDEYDFNGQISESIVLKAKWEETTDLRVIFDDGVTRKQVWVAPNTNVAKPADPVKEFCIFDGWFNGESKFDFDTEITSNLELKAKLRNVNSNVTDLKTGFTFGDSTLKGSFGHDMSALVNYGKGSPSWEKVAGEKTGDDAYKIYFHSYGMGLSQKAIVFDEGVDVEEISYLKIRVFAHLSSGATYSCSMGGIRLYPLDKDGLDNQDGYMIPADIKQDQWVDVIITGNDLLKLANADGMIEGIQLGAFFHTNNDADLYQGSFNEKKAHLVIDGFTVGRQVYITYQGEGLTTETVPAYTGLAFEYRIPTVEGKIFVGWFDADEQEITKNKILDYDIVATARFVNAETLADGVYWKATGNGKLGEGAYIIVNNGLIDISDIVDEQVAVCGFNDNTVIAYLRDGTRLDYTIGESDFVKSETVDVTFDLGYGSPLSYKVVVGKTLDAVEIERLGYILNGWKVSGQSEFYNFETPISQNTNFVASWSYDEIPEDGSLYTTYSGSYYGATSKTLLTLSANKKYTLEVNGQKTNGEFIILKSGTLVLMSGNESNEYAVTGQTIEWKNQEMLVVLKDVVVSFVTNNGTIIDSQTVGAAQGYKATQPQPLTKEGFVFDGWLLADGSVFDFDTVLTESVELRASWKVITTPNPTPIDGDSGCGSSVDSLCGMLTCLTLVAILFLTLKKKLKKD